MAESRARDCECFYLFKRERERERQRVGKIKKKYREVLQSIFKVHVIKSDCVFVRNVTTVYCTAISEKSNCHFLSEITRCD